MVPSICGMSMAVISTIWALSMAVPDTVDGGVQFPGPTIRWEGGVFEAESWLPGLPMNRFQVQGWTTPRGSLGWRQHVGMEWSGWSDWTSASVWTATSWTGETVLGLRSDLRRERWVVADRKAWTSAHQLDVEQPSPWGWLHATLSLELGARRTGRSEGIQGDLLIPSRPWACQFRWSPLWTNDRFGRPSLGWQSGGQWFFEWADWGRAEALPLHQQATGAWGLRFGGPNWHWQLRWRLPIGIMRKAIHSAGMALSHSGTGAGWNWSWDWKRSDSEGVTAKPSSTWLP